jgi:hypothetical protein
MDSGIGRGAVASKGVRRSSGENAIDPDIVPNLTDHDLEKPASFASVAAALAKN